MLKKLGHNLSPRIIEKVRESTLKTLRDQGEWCMEGYRYVGHGQCDAESSIRPDSNNGSQSDEPDYTCHGCIWGESCDRGRCISNGSGLSHCFPGEHDRGDGRCVSDSMGDCNGILRWNGVGCS